MRINVMGASGQLGRKVVKALLRQGLDGEQIVASARTPSKLSDLETEGVSHRQADYDDPHTLKAAFEESDTVLLIPSFAPVEARIQQHANALDAAREAGVQRVVFASFAAASPESKFLVAPFMLYAESKLRLSGLDWTIVRNGMYLDPIADWVPELVEQGRLPYPVENGRVAYICRDDLARALAAVCCQDGYNGELYELTGPEALSMPELADTISRVAGKPVRYEQVSEEEFASECRKAGEPEPLIAVLTSMYRAVDNGEFEKITDHVERLTGQPAESVESYLRRTLGD